MRYRLRTLLILMLIVPPFIAAPIWIHDARQRARMMPCGASNLRQLTPAEMAQRTGKPLKPAAIKFDELPSD